VTGTANSSNEPKRTKEEIEATAKELSRLQHIKFMEKEKQTALEQEK